jgi:hypothetical protein
MNRMDRMKMEITNSGREAQERKESAGDPSRESGQVELSRDNSVKNRRNQRKRSLGLSFP